MTDVLPPSDRELLRRWRDEGVESAFAELVRRHYALVHGAALRHLRGDAHTADDITQQVFSALARKSRSLADRPNLAGWLYTSTRFAAAGFVRSAHRRRRHEAAAHTMNETNAPAPVSWERIEPLLDRALERLSERDREAVLLHFFEGQTFAKVGLQFNTNADAMRMRVNRALEQLRTEFGRLGLVSSSAALAEALLLCPATAAPPALAATIAAQATASCAAGGAAALVERILAGVFNRSAVLWVSVPAVLIGLGLVASITLSHPPPSLEGLPPSPPIAPSFSAVPREPLVQVSADDPLAGDEPSAPPTHPVGPGSGSEPSTLSFAAMTDREKWILRTLWEREEAFAPDSGRRWAVNMPVDAPARPEFVAARRHLRLAGLVAVGRARGLTYLTPAGLAYCAQHQAELLAFDLPSTPRPMGPAADPP